MSVTGFFKWRSLSLVECLNSISVSEGVSSLPLRILFWVVPESIGISCLALVSAC